MIAIREARETDAIPIGEIFLATYGTEYAYPIYYDELGLKKLIFSENTVMLVAEDEDSGRVVGTASVMLEAGAYTDLVGEFGRLAVHPDWRNRRIGTQLLEARVESVRNRLHIGLMEVRITHPFTQAIAQKHGFAPVGFLPLKFLFGTRRESMALLVRYFGRALDLRRNNPRIVSEVYQLAGTSMQNCKMDLDVIVDEEATAYPFGQDFQVEELTTEGYSRLMRIERGRVRNREVFGPMRLQYGFFKLTALHARYLIAREGGQIIGAIGFIEEQLDRNVRIFELISLRDDVIRFLLSEVERRCREEWDIAYVEIDVSADAPRMQRTLLQLGFVPVAYAPALAFHHVERLDVVKMARLHTPLDVGSVMLIPPTRGVCEMVLSAFARREVLPRLGEVLDRVGLFSGLDEEQVLRLAGACGHATYAAGETIFREGDPCTEMFLILEGTVEIRMSGNEQPVGTVSDGEVLGEVAALTGGDHSATAIAATDVDAGILTKTDLNGIVRLRPGIGVILYRNLARGLGEKLRRTDRRRGSDEAEGPDSGRSGPGFS